MGIGVSDYGEQFFDLMADHLPAPAPEPFPIVPIIVVTVVLGAALVVWRARRRRGGLRRPSVP
ncbi:MAG: hypothetical protein GTN62_02645 [Gemmatimonadales bacterium]|nr:hypothetical protein [Gemmatimonadales bacterium]NIN10670.1 hypothetical protein [Gemmatimonadales bacterium]NIN48997.1 hypothetical protein [Gemmatimonadales bacterium]NIP06461.1 hypothetical protein [Gemmatimonadales bacterium]NIQ98807.1 hypothetical protein [Gemmatimonadales bacterium]